MNFMKIPGQPTLDLKRSTSNTSDSHRKQTLEFQEEFHMIFGACAAKHVPQVPV